MAEVMIREKVWQQLLALARKQRRKPAALVESAVSDYVERLADQALDAATRRAARRAKFDVEQCEEIIRQHRQLKALQATDGRTQASNPRRR